MSAIQIESLLAGLTDTNGEPLSGGKVYTYAAGTLTDKDTYLDRAKATPATNPIILDSNGRAQVYAEGAYKFIIKTSSDVTITTLDDLFYEGAASESIVVAGLATGSADAMVINPGVGELTDGLFLQVLSPGVNTISAPTINMDGLGAKIIRRVNTASVFEPGDITANQILHLVYVAASGVFVLQNPYLPTPLQVQAGSYNVASVSGGTANAFSLAISDILSAYSNGLLINFKASYTNTGAVTVNVNSIGTKRLLTAEGSELVSGQIVQGGQYLIRFSGSSDAFVVLNPSATWLPHTPSITGFLVNPFNVCRYLVEGKKCTLAFRTVTAGISNGTGFTISAPLPAKTYSGMVWFSFAWTTNDGTANVGYATIQSASSAINVYPSAALSNWVTSGSKAASFIIEYELE